MAEFDSSYDDKAAIALAVAESRHRDVVGGMWDVIGVLQFEFLKQNGLSAGDHLLDIGCGSLRGGVHFAAFLEPGHYWGIDSNESLIDAGHRIELANLGLADRTPRSNLLHDNDFNFERFGRIFDIAIAHSLFTHLPTNRVRLCLDRLAAVMRAGGRLFATYFETPEDHLWDEPCFHQRGSITTFGNRDPYHYRRSEMAEIANGLPWAVTWSGDWGHPRDQTMMIFQRLPMQI